MAKQKTIMTRPNPICLHDGGRRPDNSYGGCLLGPIAHEKCKPSTCDDYTPPPKPEPAHT
jgi:hypothetical protein